MIPAPRHLQALSVWFDITRLFSGQKLYNHREKKDKQPGPRRLHDTISARGEEKAPQGQQHSPTAPLIPPGILG